MNPIRVKRFENLIRQKVSLLIMNKQIKDPRVDSSITITRVKAAQDLSSARLWISSFGGEDATERSVQGLNKAAGFIQILLGKELRCRNTPKLFFKIDNSIAEAFEINHLIDRINN